MTERNPLVTTQLPPVGADDVVYLIDVNCWVYKYYYTVSGQAARMFIDFVAKILRNRRPAYFGACADMPFPNWRHAIAPKREDGTGYKAKREPPDATLLERLRWAREMTGDVHGVPVVERKGYEADDVIATLTAAALKEGLRVVILGKDKDLLQLVRADRVWMWNGKEMVWGPDEVVRRFEVRPEQMRDYQAIVGDLTDNVPGTPGLGPKAAVRLLKAYADIEAIYADIARLAALEALDPVLDTMHQKMVKGRVDLELSRRLVTLATDAPLAYTLDDLRR